MQEMEHKANSTWLASSIQCCFPTRQNDEQSCAEKAVLEPEAERHAPPHGRTIRREPSMPMSSVYTGVDTRAMLTAVEYYIAAPVTLQLV